MLESCSGDTVGHHISLQGQKCHGSRAPVKEYPSLEKWLRTSSAVLSSVKMPALSKMPVNPQLKTISKKHISISENMCYNLKYCVEDEFLEMLLQETSDIFYRKQVSYI